MDVSYLPIVFNLISSLALVFVISSFVRLMSQSEDSRSMVFFTFAMVSYLVSNLYWLAYEIMRPGTRMPFAVNEIGEWAAFLLMSATLTTIFHGRQAHSVPERAFGVFFIVWSAGLWICWSGEWIQDILTGFAFGYLAVNTLNSIRVTDALTRKTEAVLASVIAILMMLHTSIFFLPDEAGAMVDRVCYAIMFALLIYFAYLTIKAFKSDADPEKLVSITFLSFLWSTSVMYMSADPMYYVPQLFTTINMVLMSIAVRRVVRKS